MADLYEKAMICVFTELDQVGKDYMLQMVDDRFKLLNSVVMNCIDGLSPESVSFWGPDGTIKNVRLALERACDQSLTDNQEDTK